MVRDDEAVGRDERGGAAAERHDRAHRLSGEIGERLRVAGESERLEPGREIGDLLWHPHALVGTDARDGGGEYESNEGETNSSKHGWRLLSGSDALHVLGDHSRAEGR